MAKDANITVTEDAEPGQSKESSHSDSPMPETSRGVILPFRSIPRPFGSTTTLTRNLKATLIRTSPKFPKFMQLPTELRLKIWAASFEPRVHELHPCSRLYNDRMTFRSNASRTPAIFHACHESRTVALENYRLMEYSPVRGGSSGKGILRFYFCPKLDTLLLNSLIGLFMMFVMLEGDADYAGTMKGWEMVAFDAERLQLITLFFRIPGHSASSRIKEVFPSLKQLIIAFDYSKRGKTRFRASVWPGENGTSLKAFPWPVIESGQFNEIFRPMRESLANDADGREEVPEMVAAKVKRKVFIRGDVRYVFRKCCAFVGLRPRGVFRRI